MKPSDLSMGRVENNWIFKSKKKSGLNHQISGFPNIGIWKCGLECGFSHFSHLEFGNVVWNVAFPTSER
jgi:hypothetical protein